MKKKLPTDTELMRLCIQRGLELLDSEVAAEMIAEETDAGLIAHAAGDVWRLLFATLVSGGLLPNTRQTKELFAKGQLMTANLIQTAYARGMIERVKDE